MAFGRNSVQPLRFVFLVLKSHNLCEYLWQFKVRKTKGVNCFNVVAYKAVSRIGISGGSSAIVKSFLHRKIKITVEFLFFYFFYFFYVKNNSAKKTKT